MAEEPEEPLEILPQPVAESPRGIFDTLSPEGVQGTGSDVASEGIVDVPVWQDVLSIVETRDGDLSEEDILGNSRLMTGMREIMKARYSADTRNKFTMDEKYDNDLDDRGVLEEWQNWMRSLEGGQTVTTGNDAVWFAMADDEQRSMLGASFELFDAMPSIWSEETSWGGMLDGVRDYAKAGIWDPTTILGLGIGRLWTKAGAKAAGFAMRVAAKEAAEAAIKRGLSEEAARQLKREVIKKGFKSVGTAKAKGAVASTVSDMTVAVGADYVNQNLRIKTDVQGEYSIPQSVGSAFGVLLMPALLLTKGGISKLTSSNAFEDTYFAKYLDISKKFAGKGKADIEKEVIDQVDFDGVMQSLNGLVAGFKEGEELEGFVPYMIRRDEIEKSVTTKDIAGNPTLLEDFFEQNLIAHEAGLTKALVDNGFIYVPREKNDNVSRFLADAMGYLPDSFLTDYKSAFKTKFGKLPKGISKLKTSKDLSEWFLNRGRFAGKTLYNRRVASDILKKNPSEVTVAELINLSVRDAAEDLTETAGTSSPKVKKRIQYLQSIWKRTVTSHPSTVGLNVKGWGYTSMLNSFSDVVLGAVLLVKGDTKGAKGSILGAARRGVNLLDYDSTLDAAESFLRVKKDIGDELFAERSGGVDSAQILQRLGLDPNAKINQLTEKSLDILQKAYGAKLQDEVTKLISFQSALDQNIMKHYGMSYNKFMSQPNAYSKIFSEEFIEKVQEPAIRRTKRETYSTPWLEKKGSGLFLNVAKNIERFSNQAGTGLLLPFGRFFNSATATLGDYSSFNALKHLTYNTLGGGKVKDIANDEGLELLSKGLVGVGLMWGKMPNGQSQVDEAKEKVRQGIPWNNTPLGDGSLRDETSEFPGGYVEIVAQGIAHLEIDGSIPPGLAKEIGGILLTNAFRDSGAAYESLRGFAEAMVSDDPNATFLKESLIVLGNGFSRVASGITRPLEPANQIAMFITDDFSKADTRQGNKVINNSIKYVDKLFGLNKDGETRETSTRSSDNSFVDPGRTLAGVRTAPPLTPSERMLGSIGEAYWSGIRWDGSPSAEYKNRLDMLISDTLNYEAAKMMSDNDYLNLPLAERTELAAGVKKRAKTSAIKVLRSSTNYDDEMLVLEQKLMSKPKKYLTQALKLAGYDLDPMDLKDEEGGKEKIEYLIYLIENKDATIFKDLK